MKTSKRYKINNLKELEEKVNAIKILLKEIEDFEVEIKEVDYFSIDGGTLKDIIDGQNKR